MMLAHLEFDISKGVVVAEPVTSNTMTIHLESSLCDNIHNFHLNPHYCHFIHNFLLNPRYYHQTTQSFTFAAKVSQLPMLSTAMAPTISRPPFTI